MYKVNAFYSGEAFHRVAHDCIPDDWLDDPGDGHWFVPSVVNMALACEIYLKSLLSDGESQTKGHNWGKLFENLPPEIKDKIANSVQFKGDEEFYQKLSEHGKVFESWRYSFEATPKSVDLVFLENIALVLHDLAKSEVTRHDQL